MTRRCSHCTIDGHNSRTCPSRSTTPPTSNTTNAASYGGVRLFGVRLTDGSIMKKSASMSNLVGHTSSSVAAVNVGLVNPSSPDTIGNGCGRLDGYASDDTGHVNRRTDRKKGTPWTEEEHRLFLIGLHKLGKGDWRGIARNYVLTRTPTQVASHAQKYFIRQSNNGRRKRRTSLFDMTPDMEIDASPPPAPEHFLPPSETSETNQDNSISQSNENLESHPMEVTTNETAKESDDIPSQPSYIIPVPVVPAFYPPYMPVPFRFWSPNLSPTQEENPATSNHQVVRPVPVLPKDTIDVNELMGISQLTLTETRNGRLPSDFHLLFKQPLGSPSRQSAFKPRRSSSVPNLTQSFADTAAE